MPGASALGKRTPAARPDDSRYAKSASTLKIGARKKPMSKASLAGGVGTLSSGAAASAAADTADVAFGTSAAKWVSLGTATTGGYTWPAPAAFWDASTSNIRLVIKIDDYTNLNFIQLDVGTGTLGSFTNRYSIAVSEQGIRTTLRIAREGEWLVLDYPRSMFFVGGGTPDWTLVGAFRLLAQDKNGAAMTMRVGGIGLVPAPPLLPSGAVVFSFDDSAVAHWTIAKPRLDLYGAQGVAYPICDQVGGGSGVTLAQLRLMQDVSGWEIGTHALTVADHTQGFAGLTAAQVSSKFDQLKSWAATNGFVSDTHAWPNGDSDTTSETVARQYVTSARGTTLGLQSSAYPNPMRLRCYQLATITQTTAQGYIDAAKASGNVAVFLTHNIVNSAATQPDTLASVLTGVIDYAAAQSVPIMTMTGVLKQLQLI